MPDMMDINPLDSFMALFTGANGSGKSIAIASWMKKGSVYFFDFDGRMASVSNWYKQRGLKQGQLVYDTWGPSNIFEAYQKLEGFLTYCPHAAIVIDSFTAVTVSAVTFSLRRRGAKGGLNLPTTSKGDMIIPDWDEYKGETMYVTMLLDICKALAAKGIAVFWTAHPITSTKIEAGAGAGGKDKYTKQTRYAAYGAKTDSLIPIYFNEIYHFTQEFDFAKNDNIRWCFTGSNGEVTAKTALNLPIQIDWTYGNFYEIFSQKVNEGQRKIDEGSANGGVVVTDPVVF